MVTIVDRALDVVSKKRPRFEIKPVDMTPSDDVEKNAPKGENKETSIKSLSAAFDRAIAYHMSLPHADRVANSRNAIAKLAPHVGMRADNTLVPLLGKNAKLIKSEMGYGDGEPVKLPDGRGIETTGLALSPAFQHGKFHTCPNSASCKDECLGKTSGNYFKVGGGRDLSEFKGPRLNSLKKTLAMINEPEAFAVRLFDEIDAAKHMAARNGNHLGVRLNVLSDISPRVHKSIIEGHPDVSFYDYTKNNTDPIASNHHYTYSSTGVSQPHIGVQNQFTNWKSMRRRLDGGDNVAMAFSHKEHLPEFVHDEETGRHYRVVNGDSHDFRPLDIQPEGSSGVIVGLKNKKATGSVDDAARDSRGFFVHYDPMLKKTQKGTYERGESQGIGPSGKPKLGPTIPMNNVVKIANQSSPPALSTNDGDTQ